MNTKCQPVAGVLEDKKEGVGGHQGQDDRERGEGRRADRQARESGQSNLANLKCTILVGAWWTLLPLHFPDSWGAAASDGARGVRVRGRQWMKVKRERVIFPVDIWNVLTQVISDSMGRVNTSTMWYEEKGTECVWWPARWGRFIIMLALYTLHGDLESCWMGISVWNKNINSMHEDLKAITFLRSFPGSV